MLILQPAITLIKVIGEVRERTFSCICLVYAAIFWTFWLHWPVNLCRNWAFLCQGVALGFHCNIRSFMGLHANVAAIAVIGEEV